MNKVMLKKLRQDLLKYYLETHRDLPWRHTKDPYKIWVSEIMLQQTQVKTVKPRWAPFLEHFPTVAALANAQESEVCEAWAGLGFYRRARNLHKAAQVVVEKWGGELPKSAEELQQLPGIGRYTAGAIASIAYGEESALVDGNVIRVFARLFALEGRSDEKHMVERAWELAEELVFGERPGDWNQALMEHGATICTPQLPTCAICPIQTYCQANDIGDPTRFPATAKQPKKANMSVAYAWSEQSAGLVLEQRALEGLWPGLWELPSSQAESEQAARILLEKKLGLQLDEELACVKHTLSHRNVTARIYGVSQELKKSPALKREVYKEPLEAPLSSLAKKAIRAVLK